MKRQQRPWRRQNYTRKTFEDTNNDPSRVDYTSPKSSRPTHSSSQTFSLPPLSGRKLHAVASNGHHQRHLLCHHSTGATKHGYGRRRRHPPCSLRRGVCVYVCVLLVCICSCGMWLALWCACGAPSGVHVGNATASTVKYVCVCFCSCACCAQCKMLLRFDVVKDCLSQVLRFACLATQVCVCLSVCLCLCLCLAVCCRNAPRSLSGQVRVCVSLSDI